jgi:sensor histidine kinase YesM
MEATAKVNGTKEIRFKLLYDRHCLFITVSNPYKGTLQKDKNTFITSKPNKQFHGYGLNNIKKMIKKYLGNIDIDNHNHVFTVNITLYDIETENT